VALFCVTYDSGYDLYVQIKPHNLETVWDGTAFVTYDVNDWADYAVTLAESTPGVYYGTWPTSFAAGYYDIFVYSGATPVSTDSFIGSGTEYTPATTTAPTLPNYSAAWYAKTPFNPNVSVGTLTIASGANEYLGWDFSNYPQIERGETLSSFSITCASATITGTTSGGAVGLARFSGAALSAVATVSVTATFSGGDAVVHTGSLSIV